MLTEDRFRLEDMRDYAKEASEILGDREVGEVLAERLRELALIRVVEIVGEAAARITPQTREHFSAIPWREASDFRNTLIHGYSKVRMQTVVDVVRQRFPSLITELDRILAEGGEIS